MDGLLSDWLLKLAGWLCVHRVFAGLFVTLVCCDLLGIGAMPSGCWLAGCLPAERLSICLLCLALEQRLLVMFEKARSRPHPIKAIRFISEIF